KKLQVPFYQRSYVWDVEQWDRLLEDLEYVSASREPYFLGTVILKSVPTSVLARFAACNIIVDGQQCVTTLLLFAKVFCLKMNQSSLFDFTFRNRQGEIALEHGKLDQDAFAVAMQQTAAQPITGWPEPSQIIAAYNYFVANLDEKKFDWMVINQNIQLVYITLNQNEDEQQVFDTINSLGVKLTTAELLKNYLFTRDNVQQYSQAWEEVFEKDAATRTYWDTEVEVGRFKRSLIDLFLDAYFQILIREPGRNVKPNDLTLYARTDRLARSYQDFVKKYCGGDKNIILNELGFYANLFRANIDPGWCNKSVPAQYGIERLNVIMFGLKNTTPIPYILFIEKNVPDEKEQAEMYRVLESYLMRRMVVAASTKNYNNLFMSLVQSGVTDAASLVSVLKDTDNTTLSIPDNDALHNGFQNSWLYNVQSKGVLYLIESGIRPKMSAVSLLGFRSYSLEHLMPKKWRNNWKLVPATPEAQKERDRKLQTLGNLAIITQSLNASIRDSAWEEKKNPKPVSNKVKPGLASCASGLETMRNVLDKEAWNEEEITARADWLYEQAAKLWAI
ncbi:MAG: DUF262 domain-containing HNH endonuclease family protein, partial [Clostridiales bacterium]|nr:DUF262 domain-containing HNH endonuclease family protein [Clostridiales bacterium]